jgi:hypothetical protein
MSIDPHFSRKPHETANAVAARNEDAYHKHASVLKTLGHRIGHSHPIMFDEAQVDERN